MGKYIFLSLIYLYFAYLMTCDIRKQARRTGMAGPLGEMFDHGWLFYSCHFTLLFLLI